MSRLLPLSASRLLQLPKNKLLQLPLAAGLVPAVGQESKSMKPPQTVTLPAVVGGGRGDEASGNGPAPCVGSHRIRTPSYASTHATKVLVGWKVMCIYTTLVAHICYIL